MNRKLMFFMISVALLFLYGWFIKTYDPGFLGLLAGTLLYSSVIQLLFTRWIEEND